MNSNRDIDVSYPRLSPWLAQPLLRSRYGAFPLSPFLHFLCGRAAEEP